MKPKLTLFALALLITVLAGNAYGDPAGNSYENPWDEEKIKSLGISLIPDKVVILCEPELKIGFNWKNGTNVEARFRKQKRIFKKISPQSCLLFKQELVKDPDTIYSRFDGVKMASRNICISHKIFGDEPLPLGGICKEYYLKDKDNEGWEASINCKNALLIPIAKILPNGLYHLTHIASDLRSNPLDGRKDSSYVEWGKCSTISP